MLLVSPKENEPLNAKYQSTDSLTNMTEKSNHVSLLREVLKTYQDCAHISQSKTTPATDSKKKNEEPVFSSDCCHKHASASQNAAYEDENPGSSFAHQKGAKRNAQKIKYPKHCKH